MHELTRPRAAMITGTGQAADLPDIPSMTGSEANPMQPHLSHQLRMRQLIRTGSHQEIDMNRIHRIRRFLGVLAGLAGTLLAYAATGPAALAQQVPPAGGGTGLPPAVRYVTAGGMAGWQITVIALGAALLAATAAVLLDRARAARRSAVTASA